jgi:flagellar motor protein MotB
MMQGDEASIEDAAPVWAVFGDLMSGLLGAFVLLLVGVLVIHLEVATHLEAEVKLRQQEEQRRLTLEKALAIPLASGRITLDNGRIGISGRFLFTVNSDQLQPEGKRLLESLIKPLQTFLTSRGEILMISGFTDDRSIRDGNNQFTDNWELSAQRALTVTRALIDAGMPSRLVFAAAFGSEQPIAPNADEKGRTLNRRVEMSPVPRTTHSKPVTHE